MITCNGNARLRHRNRRGLNGPIDVMLDHSALECVSGNPEQLRGFDNAARASECLDAQETLGFTKIQVFQEDRHGPEHK